MSQQELILNKDNIELFVKEKEYKLKSSKMQNVASML